MLSSSQMIWSGCWLYLTTSSGVRLESLKYKLIFFLTKTNSVSSGNEDFGVAHKNNNIVVFGHFDYLARKLSYYFF